ncbi:FabD/lysophospholipase-like protein [Cryphonectria parasitica EP155]|uniref:Lysophospholipase n=1 Tax=Cryphonectria parasitica (strain ATCC 38755 / EP155) TaxID=660469 RepID=A0A9P4Y6E4_CRYP1|nr:FabD/lysophospholipase-like protein [Cryphonectria parasitica EP155]KAF3767563.1 FabD/lysophospholipase-like protein [Cryphonectria parasitica EP155]
MFQIFLSFSLHKTMSVRLAYAAKSQDSGAWFNFATTFENFRIITDTEWRNVPDKMLDYILPEWSKMLPGFIRKLQRELSMAPGSLADEIWQEAHDPDINPEIRHSAQVRVSQELCDDEMQYLARRKKMTAVALAKYLGLEEDDVHEDDVPTVAMCGSGGGLRALVAGAGSMLATEEDGLFDCVTYTSGVSGSCWLQALYHSSFAAGSLDRVLDHLKSRIGVHIAYPPVAFSSLSSAPTSKYLLSGLVEKLKGDPNSYIGLVDVYGLLLSARLLVPKGELGVDGRDFKLSNQRQYIRYGQHPLPIYTAVRHEIPNVEAVTGSSTGNASEAAKEEAVREAWFQWFELTPYEVFCEEFAAGIPTWALGRRFKDGRDIPPEDGFHLPEVRMPLLMGIFGSAFCATLSHYYREVRPLMQSLTGFATIDEMISGHNEDLSKVHPIDPATIPNFTYGMEGKLRQTTPTSIYNHEYLQLMDAGMSNNLPIYPLLRPGRNIEVIIAFDASADVRTDNWLSVADGYARQRGIKGWPLGVGWPRPGESDTQVAKELDQSESVSATEAERKLTEAKIDQAARRLEAGVQESDVEGTHKFEKGEETSGELGYCTVWVGTTQERSSEPPPPSKALEDADAWQLMEPDAGITVVYMPFLKNDKVESVDPGQSEYMSTWNFVYTPEEVEKVVALARANYDEGREKIRKTIRAVYERKKRRRLEREKALKAERRRREVSLGVSGKLGEGDHFS